MTLQSRIIILFSALLLVILALAWWGSRWLTQDLSRELDRVAAVVGESVITAIDEQDLTVEDSDIDVVVLVERTIETDGQVIRALQRQEGNTLTELSVQVDEAEPQVLEFAPGQRIIAENMRAARIQLHQVIEANAGSGGLKLVGGLEPRVIEVPKEGVSEAMQQFSTRLVLGLMALFLAGMIAAAFIGHRVSRPLRGLQEAAQRVGEGELGAQVDSSTDVSEVRDSINAFNRMSVELKELQEAQEKLRDQQHLSELGDIGRGLAHSLRNPLNAIGLALEELASAGGADDGKARQLADTARAQIQRIDGSIRAFLTLASAGSTQAEPLDVSEIVQDVVLEGLQRSDLNCRIEFESGGPAPLQGVAAEIRAMIQSLIVNSVEASSSGQSVEVKVGQPDDGHDEGVEIQILDRGSGIDAGIREQLFQPHATTKADGSGMGLFLTQRLAASRYQGSVALADREGGGAMATLRLGNRINGDD
ncbi:MAG: HAMP domain-containing sensor histidine kinase [Xanthomonadales bacterium]|nr:HAMP domain-containing sensor histidine kinase [Xanthomonadales bacterium]